MTDSESDIEIKSALTKKRVKMPASPSDGLNNNLKKTTTKMMIQDALTELKSRKGVSLHAIKKHLEDKFQVNTEKLNYVIKKTIKTGVEDGTFIRLKGVGASGSFKLAKLKEKAKKPKKKAPEKGTDETKKKKLEKSKKTMEKVEIKPKMRAKEKMEDNKPNEKQAKVKVTKKPKEKEMKAVEERVKKTKLKMAQKTPTKKKTMIARKKSIGSIIKPPKMKPKLK